MKQINLAIALFFLTIQSLVAQKPIAPPALSTITVADLKKDLYALADAHYKGRSAGTIDELKASMWLSLIHI